jgi:ABC-type multidrug transport system ATPase subunit
VWAGAKAEMAAIVVAQNLVKAYGSNVAVRDFNLTIDDGEVVALVGAVGAGKSTVLKIIAADLRPDAGSASVCGFDTVLQAGLVRPRIGVVQHERFLEGGLSGRENLDEQAMLRFFTPGDAEQRIGELLPLVALGDRIEARASTYSLAEWACLELAACLIHRPQLLIVDEPARGCDAAGREKVLNALRLLRPQVKSVLFATPDASEAQALGARIVRIEHD